MSDKQDEWKLLVAEYRKQVNKTPLLESLLYDADLLPEQVASMRGAISMAAVVIAYNEGRKPLEAQLADLRLELLSALGEAGANLDRAVKAEAALAAMQDPAALTVAYLAGVESERDRAKIEGGGP